MNDPRVFRLNRLEDETGISGVGIVAQGLLASDGTVAMRWLTEHRSWCIYETILEVWAIHGHDGRTAVEFYEKGEWRSWQPKRDWLKTKTGSVPLPEKTMNLAPWEIPPRKVRSKARLSSKVLTDAEVVHVEAKLKAGGQNQRNQLPSDERMANLEERMTRRSIVRAAEEATEEAWKSRRFKY